jgi:aspartate kinase
LASLIEADEVWIWTDVDGVMSADPRKIKDALVMPTISYEEVSEFAHFGAKVLHPRAVEPLMVPHIPLRVCNTFNPEVAGTRINSQQSDGPRHLNAVTAIDGVLVFAPNSGEGSAENMVAMQKLIDDILSQQFSQEAQPIITVDSHAGRLLCYVVPTTARRTAMQESVEVLSGAFGERYPDLVWRVEPISIVAAIGVVEIQQTVQVLNAVKSAKAELLAMGHGSPQCCLLAVPPQQAIRVMKRLHRMVVSIQSNLRFAENDPQRPATVNVPTTRRKQNGRQRRSGGPPHRVIPL